jgi:hypothetical protein
VLADALRTDGHRLVPLVPDTPRTVALRVVSRARKSLVATRVALANELRANLEVAFPGAATLGMPGPVPRPCVADLPGRGGPIHPAVRQTQEGRIPLRLREAPRRGHGLCR